ncbi:MAG: carbamoyltransferase HypF [Acidimicrobiia bacterium]|nr:carbamoyltransferase HypF [Acidimicrobiia bacterium]
MEVYGAVQGVGFRPFVFRLAEDLDLAGWVINDTRGVFVEVEGPRERLEAFRDRLVVEKPPRSEIHAVEAAWLDPAGFEGFEIRHSDPGGEKTVVVLPDTATCDDCLAEVFDPADRRYRYPFTNCTNCGPRFSIIEAVPYDRPNTTMRIFPMCAECRREYEDPRDRRFHAQPNACPVCGPHLSLVDADGRLLAERDDALEGAAAAVEQGRILALKGLGGFLLIVDARSQAAVVGLRERKARYEKPLALMAADLDGARHLGEVSAEAVALLTGPEAPIVLLPRHPDAGVAEAVAPGNVFLGVMLPYTPLHHLLLRRLGFPVVATSGNLSDEPICIDETEALARLGGIADIFLVHDRPIARHVDDSVVAVVAGAPRPIRRARGYAPLPVRLDGPAPTLLAVGAHLKNTVALSVGERVFLSQHIGDMETVQALGAFERVIADFLGMYEAGPVAVVHDLHPDYASTRWAEGAVAGEGRLGGLPLVAVQHHHAHLASCLAENGGGRALGVTWDGTGYGTDGTVWGGEFLAGDAAGVERVAHLRPFRLPGGDAAVVEPRRSALAALWEVMGERVWDLGDVAAVAGFAAAERAPLGRMLATGFRTPTTTSCGRLFDAVAALGGLPSRVSFEGQAAMLLEHAVDPGVNDAYPLPLVEGSGPMVLDWGPLLEAVLGDMRRGVPVETVAGRFHNALVEGILAVAAAAGEPRVALTGGCFQNRILTERAAARLEGAGFEVLLHRRVPANDGGISLGQIAVASARWGGGKEEIA